MGRPNAVVTAPNITINDDQMMAMQDEAIRKLQDETKQIRKRFALLQMNESVFILGGYTVHLRTGEKVPTKNDYLYVGKAGEDAIGLEQGQMLAHRMCMRL